MLKQILQFIGRQEWLRFGIRDRLIRSFYHPDNVSPEEFEVEFGGFTYRGNMACFLDWNVFFYGAYSKREMLFLKDILLKLDSPVVFDVGANIGHHSLYLAPHAREVHCFEPYDRVSEKIIEKIHMNRVQNIFLHRVGLSECEALLNYFPPTGNNTGTGSFIEKDLCQGSAALKFQVVNGDQYVARLGLKKVDLLKIDTEGWEKNVIAGLQMTIRRYRPHIFMEFSDDTFHSFRSADEFFALFPDYRIFEFVGNEAVGIFFNRRTWRLKPFDFFHDRGDLYLEPLNTSPPSSSY